MEGLFGLDSCKSPSWRDNVKATVGNYFKAWEFFLLTPNTEQLEEEERHKKFCHAITSLSRQILASAKTTNQSKFIEDLALVKANDENQIVQCITEMLLAGTDTSSLTMFYTSLLLTDNPQVGNQLSKLINDSSTPESNTIEQMISNLYYESMRLVSVGPVILRQAEDNISLEGPDFNLKLNKGDGIVFNIAGQNLNEDPFTCAKKFDPNRYDTGGESYPLTFGTGSKSCVGKPFAEREMKLFFSWFLKKWTLLGTTEDVMGLLKTRWDIANAPLTDLKLYIFPRIGVHFIGNCETVLDTVKEFRMQFPRLQCIKLNGFDDVELAEVWEGSKNKFVIIYGGSVQEYGKVKVPDNDLIIFFENCEGEMDRECGKDANFLKYRVEKVKYNNEGGNNVRNVVDIITTRVAV